MQRRRELGLKHFDDIETLQAIASASKAKITRLPPLPQDDDTINPAPAPAPGPCQSHVEYFKNRRAGKLPPVVQDEEPYVDERTARLLASRAYQRDLAIRKKLEEPTGRLKRRSKVKK